MTKMAAAAGSGVAGVVAQSSDVVRDGCSERPLGTAILQVWTLEEPLDSLSRAAEVVSARLPDLTREVEGGYREPLEPGWYLLCVRPSCVELNVHEDETLTVNIERRDGPTSFFLDNASTGRLEEDYGFEVGY
jgi:hypothetical protein